jgi:hypothetical protein
VNDRLVTGKALVTSEIIPVGNFIPLVWGVQLYAMPTNTNTIYIVGPGQTIDEGYPLAAGVSVLVRIDDLSKVLVCADVGGTSAGVAQELRYFAW